MHNAGDLVPAVSVRRQSLSEMRGLFRERFRWLIDLWHKPLGVTSLVFLLLVAVAAVFSETLAPYDPLESHVADRLLGPSIQYLFGTDQLGRDVLSRIIFGARQSMRIGATVVGLIALIGTAVGVASGYFGGKFDLVVQRIVDAMQAMPGLILAMALVSITGAGTLQVIFAITVVATPSYSRVIRSAVLPVKENQYVEAAKALGAGDTRIVLRHVLPNIVAPILVLVSTSFGLAILTEGSLSFLGLGTPPPTPSWGNMIGGDARRFLESAPTLSLFPGLAITLSVLAFNLLGDALRDVLDPRSVRHIAASSRLAK